MEKIDLTIGDTDFVFNIDHLAYNKFIKSASQGPVNAAFNLMTSTVDEGQKKALKDILIGEQNVIKGRLVMSIMGEIEEEFSSTLPLVVKRQTSVMSNVSGTDSSSS